VIQLPLVYLLAGLMFAGFAAESLFARADRRRGVAGAFLGLVALSFLFGDRLGDLGNGVLALLLAGLAVWGFGGRPAPDPADAARREAGAARHGDRLFALALIVPAVALAGALGLKGLVVGGLHLVDPKQTTVVALAAGVLAALAVAWPVLRYRPREPLAGGGGLARTVGWALMLPQMLAALGAVFALSGVGGAVADLATRLIAPDDRLAVVCAYTIGMALFTLIMGNAFAAFPVMTAGIGLPLIVRRLHGDPAIMGSIGMLSGFCGTLLTPMAANFNVVPVALLELPDRWAVIRAQAPTALILLGVNTALMYALVFRF
jgi:uncharacterized membrane protein